eukprot:CAMPEP_0170528086 /NCGR_PEP_ID=MMETSP0209-20121228/13583_1 /TAXON_ID=665100 ORGANISM="Litonotus pictus, Strain P1" /NCGR_SAMPLE_ID=MMETSP0209 /ASSEMBLY_ACC=CAM_ASM_000301 /LENGTH=255 /DNA_ID=CAMNT_0010819069 /DNA_START=225 /DNA_END=992 /DNA_ORIENTATION=+
MKKKAFDPVDKALEKEKDPKYKTELCKTFEEQGICPYGNTCRFAHGKLDFMPENKEIENNCMYKLRDCSSFFNLGYCPYGSRCHFKHSPNTLPNINRQYYSLLIESDAFSKRLLNEIDSDSEHTEVLADRYSTHRTQRLSVFEQITSDKGSVPREDPQLSKKELNFRSNSITSMNSVDQLDKTADSDTNEYPIYKKIKVNSRYSEYYPKPKKEKNETVMNSYVNFCLTNLQNYYGRQFDFSSLNTVLQKERLFQQ